MSWYSDAGESISACGVWGACWGCAVGYGEERRGCWEASREGKKTSLCITPLPAGAQLSR